MTAPAASEVLATVNGKDITDEDLKIAAEDLGASIPQQLQGKARDAYLLDYLIDSELVAQKARRISSTRIRPSPNASPTTAAKC